ncbi:MAG TPA: cation:proton antiporter, partial [Kofleriaceae bacterium]|nr:cation:proton antiporter [Kofleriaceae bacterium]
MTGSHILVELVVVLGTAAVITVLFQALRLPVVLGYVLAGLVIGPHVPVPLVANAGLVHVLSELGVILLMFTIGLELRLSTIARVGLPAAVTALFEVGLVIAVGTLVARLVGFDAGPAVFAGACLGISSTMLVAKAFEERGWKGGFTEVVFAILVFEDLIAILLFAILAGVATGAGLAAPDVAALIGRLAGFLALMLVAGLLVVPRAIRWVAHRARTETLLIGALAVCFGLAGLAAYAGYSVALGAFVGGVLVAESGHGEAVFDLVRPFRDVFAMIFFVSVGMTIDPSMLATEAPRIAAFTAVVLAMKPLGVALGVFFAGHGVHAAVRSGLSLAQIGELSFVIAGIAGDATLLAIAVGVSCATTITSPLLIGRSERAAAWVAARLPKRIAMFVSFYEAWLARLRAREGSTWQKLRRPLLVLVLDAGVVTALVIAGAALGPRYLRELGLGDWLHDWLIDALLVLAVAAASAPFVVGMVRRVVVIARRLAAEVIPSSAPDLPEAAGAVDLGRAPRRALTVMFELAIALAITVPMVAAVQPFVPGSLVVVALAALAIVFVLRRSIADFEGHVRAGSALILELLSQPHEEAPLAQVEAVLPGFGGTATHTLGEDAAAIGRSLAQLDLRARTGATVLAIARRL